jgi:hypothetical protein
MKYRHHLGHPEDRSAGPLEFGWHAWHNEQGKITGIVQVSFHGEILMIARPRTAEEAADRAESCAHFWKEQAEQRRRWRMADSQMIEKYWNVPVDY